jgi:AcrR family transcriptional regulator
MMEFSSNGLAGGRIDNIARRARINKRMLYCYFGDKENLFCNILKQKLTQHALWPVTVQEDPREILAYWFDLACHDRDWIRLLEWEALQGTDRGLIAEDERLKSFNCAVDRLRQSQAQEKLPGNYDPRQLLLAFLALTTFPLAFPQLTRLITGLRVTDRKFREQHSAFLCQFAGIFQSQTKPNLHENNYT